MITVVPLWAKSGLRSNLRASNLQNFPGGAYPHTPLECACLYACTQIVHPPISNVFRCHYICVFDLAYVLMTVCVHMCVCLRKGYSQPENAHLDWKHSEVPTRTEKCFSKPIIHQRNGPPRAYKVVSKTSTIAAKCFHHGEVEVKS